MIVYAHGLAPVCGYLLITAAMIYSLVALAASLRRSASVGVPCHLPPITVLKPLCGVQSDTHECLRSFCDQEYPDFQIIFGVSDPLDPVLEIVRRLRSEFPACELKVVIDGRIHGRNRKVSNLINMMSAARHDYLVVSDSDVRVRRDYLRKVVAPLLDTDVGIVTCAYRGVHRHDIWSHLGSLFINEWFIPSVRVAAIGRANAFAFGATIAIRRPVLAQIGGFTAVANQLADDYRLGEMTRLLGLRTVLSEVVVDTFVAEGSFTELVHHELRWLRTIRSVRPLGYGFCFITFGFPTVLVGAWMTEGAPIGACMAAITLVARMLLHGKQSGVRGGQVWLVPLRDALSLCLWSWSFATRRVRWGDSNYRVSRDGSLLPRLSR